MVSVRSVVGRVRRRVGRSGAVGDVPVVRGVPVDVAGLAVLVDGLGPVVVAAVRQRAAEVAAVLSGESGVPAGGSVGQTRVVLDALVAALTPMDRSRAWLLVAVLSGRLPVGSQVETIVRVAELDGIETAVTQLLAQIVTEASEPDPWPTVSVIAGRQLVDVEHTSTRDVATGIQRVTREVTRRWVQTHDPVLIGWRADLTAIRVLSQQQAHRACWGGPPAPPPGEGDPIVVPWRCTYLLPELAIEIDQVARLQKMAEHSGTSLNIIGYDLVPITTAETINDIIAPGFARNLAAGRYVRNIAAISQAAAHEYRGWRTMLVGTGLPGPHVEAVPLPNEARTPDPAGMSEARRRLQVGSLPLVLVVGSHEPRKNHLAVLHAAELLWLEGHQFSLTFIGGIAWKSDAFVQMLGKLRKAGRALEAITEASDDLLWGGYRLARFTVFPSLNEGYGLPVAESLACGTPVITSDFGSMKEIADAGGGALLVDPRDDHAIADAMRVLLTDDQVHEGLVDQARGRPIRTWLDYSEAVWSSLNTSR